MTPERATEILNQMGKEYRAAEAARKAGIEPPRPTDVNGAPIPEPTGLFLSPEERDAQRLNETKDYLERNGFPMRDTEVGQDMWNMIEGRSPVSSELQAEVERKLASLMHDQDWRRRFLEREARATREYHLATGIIAAGKIQRAAGK